jgi:C-terminal processing protease CtpA/Prc
MKYIFLPKRLSWLAAILIIGISLSGVAHGQKMDGIERGRMKDILKNLQKEITKNYYDPTFHGINLDERFQKAEERLDQATTTSQSLAVIAQVLVDFNDSHLYFRPPPTTLDVEYGLRYKMIGDKCIVTSVSPKSDAAAKGLKMGDELTAIQNFHPTRNELWKVQYYYNLIGKRDQLHLVVRGPGEAQTRELDIKSKMERKRSQVAFIELFNSHDFTSTDEENAKHRFVKANNVSAWRMPTFGFDPAEVDSLMARFKGSEGLILDLRSNGGGYVKTLEAIAGYLFPRDIKIADMKGRKPMDPSVAKTQGTSMFKGKIVVLVDANSGSASEIFARLMQLEKRGVVLGDVSAGAVMQAVGFNGELGGGDSVVPYGASITNADVIMKDGKSLEHVGVIPDELILPTADDVAKNRDPVLARAFEILGVKMGSEEAGKIFPGYFWPK